jgi:hypothetical protein
VTPHSFLYEEPVVLFLILSYLLLSQIGNTALLRGVISMHSLGLFYTKYTSHYPPPQTLSKRERKIAMKNESKGATAKSAKVPGAVAGISGRRRKFSVSTETAYCKHFRLLAENFGRPRNFRRVVRSAGISGEQLGPTGLIAGSVA